MFADNVISPFDLPSRNRVHGLVLMSDLPEVAPLKPWYSGFLGWKGKMQLAPGTLSVVTGHPGHGKTSLMANVWFNTADRNDLNILVATFETHPVPHYRKLLRQFHAQCAQDQMTDQQMKAADDFIDEHYRFLIHPTERPTLDWIFEWAVKGGNEPDVLIIDPWNRLETQRLKEETETEYIAACLSALRIFAVQQQCHVQMIAHPAKRDARLRDNPPILEDISGSKNWDNMPDQGISVHREQFWDSDTKTRRWDAKVYHLKARFEELGYPQVFNMRLNPKTWCFEETDPALKKNGGREVARRHGKQGASMPVGEPARDEPPPPSYE